MSQATIPPLAEAVARSGTQEPTSTPRILRAGSLAAESEADNVRLAGAELLRAIPWIDASRDPLFMDRVADASHSSPTLAGFETVRVQLAE